MEALSPISGRVKALKRDALKRSAAGSASRLQRLIASGAATAPTSRIALPLTFMLTGLISLMCVAAWLALDPNILTTYHYSPKAVAITHLFALGWLCSVVMGAIYQLVPVALETKLHSERLVFLQYILHVAGFVGMVFAFHAWNMKSVGWFGSVFATGICLFIYNIARTLWGIPKWNVVALAVASALAWILLTITAGILMAAAKTGHANFMFHFSPLAAMHTHAHLGIIGFFMILIVGVSYKLVPMFTLSELQCHRRAAASIIFLNIGLAGSLFSIALQSTLKPVFALAIILALALYGFEMIAILRARKRRALDWGVKYFLTGIALLAPVSGVALVLSWPYLPVNTFTGQLENVYGFLALTGVVSLAVIGMLYKIIPFLVWYGSYSSQIGKARVPALAEMYSARLQMFGYWFFLAALVVTTIGILTSYPAVVRSGCVSIGASLVIFAINAGKILSHYFRPRVSPLIAPKNPTAL